MVSFDTTNNLDYSGIEPDKTVHRVTRGRPISFQIFKDTTGFSLHLLTHNPHTH
jgi:hypothetical protein